MKFCKPLSLPVIIAIVVACCVANSAHGETANSFVVHDVTVFDGTQRILHANVVVQDGRIMGVGAGLEMPSNLPVVEGAGKTLLPGLIDAHAHTWGSADRDALRFGVTTELDMFSDPHLQPGARQQRAAMGRVESADPWSAGILATAPGGHGTEYGFKIPTLQGPGDAATFVDGRVADGVRCGR